MEHEVIERVLCDGYIRQRVVITTYAGLRMPLYVLIPDTVGRLPAIIACHGHGYGSKEIVGLEPDGSDRNGGSGLHKDFAISLVKRGFIVAAPELLGFGDRRFPEDVILGPKANSCFRLSAQLMMVGQTLAGHRIYETMRVIDYLQTLSYVLPDQIGCMGISGGGLVAAFTAALDERISASVVSGYANTFHGSILDRNHCLDNYIPGILLESDLPDIIGLIAPRPLLIEAGNDDLVFPIASAKEAYRKLEYIYEAANATDRLTADFFSGGHEISGARAFDWFVEQFDIRRKIKGG